MDRLLPVLILLAIAGFLFWRDPRRLAIGLVLQLALTLAVMDTLGAVLDHYSDPIDHATDGFILLGVFLAVLRDFRWVNGVMLAVACLPLLLRLASFIIGLELSNPAPEITQVPGRRGVARQDCLIAEAVIAPHLATS